MKTNTTLFALLGLSLLCSCGGGGGNGGNATSSTNGAPVPNTLSGTVTFNGVPMAGVTLTAVNTNSNPSTVFGVTTTDANGNYSFSGLPTGWNATPNYQFWASKPGYGFVPQLSANPTNSTANYLWNNAPQNWMVNTGAAVTRAGFNGQFSNIGGAGMIFTVINFNSLSNNSVTGANFTAYSGSNAPVTLTVSGQQTSYVSGDDGAKRKGVMWTGARFTDNKDGTVTDTLTKLVWLKNAGCIAASTWAPAILAVNQLANGSCGLSDGSSAGQWRMPNLVELESLIDASASSPALTAGHPFNNVSNNIYWTSTVYYGGQAGTSNAWAIRLSDGRYMNDSNVNLINSSLNNVWAVKGSSSGAVKLQASGAYVPFAKGDDGSLQNGAPLPFPRMRDNNDGTITDLVTGLVWLKQANCINQNWAGAMAAINSLASGQCGLSDGSSAGSWRMPNRKEMQSLADRAQNNLASYFNTSWTSNTPSINSMPRIFNNMAEFQYYWTSTTNAANPGEAWTTFSCDFGLYNIAKSNTNYTLAVR